MNPEAVVRALIDQAVTKHTQCRTCGGSGGGEPPNDCKACRSTGLDEPPGVVSPWRMSLSERDRKTIRLAAWELYDEIRGDK